MVYLVLDTNIWIYLANGFDTSSNKFHDNHHFNLLDQLMNLTADGDICILVNEIIIEEWQRNKVNAEQKIKLLNNRLTNPSVFKELSKYVKSPLQQIKDEYHNAIKAEIAANENHIRLVEKFLFTDCQKIEISDVVKLKVYGLAKEKKAPFHNDRNNFADATILFSVQDFFRDYTWRYGDTIIFVSNNINEFTNGDNLDAFHPQIVEALDGISIQYNRRLPSALKISEDIIMEIDSYNQNKLVNHGPVRCMMSFCRYENFELESDMEVRYQVDEDISPNQISLFPKMLKRSRRSYISYHWCPRCETVHFECPKCLEVTPTLEGPDFNCLGCGTLLAYRENNKGDWYLFVHNTFQSEEEKSELE